MSNCRILDSEKTVRVGPTTPRRLDFRQARPLITSGYVPPFQPDWTRKRFPRRHLHLRADCPPLVESRAAVAEDHSLSSPAHVRWTENAPRVLNRTSRRPESRSVARVPRVISAATESDCPRRPGAVPVSRTEPGEHGMSALRSPTPCRFPRTRPSVVP